MTTNSRPRIEASPKRIRIYFGGQLIADSARALLVWEIPYYPAYYLPRADVHVDLISAGERSEQLGLGTPHYFNIRVGDRLATGAAWHFPDSHIAEIAGHVRFDWDSMDSWFEEDEEVYVHPRAPDHRIDILASSRHVKVAIEGTTVADSHRPWLLFERTLPVRYYLPLLDVRQELLRTSATLTQCPYKGTAVYWSVQTKAGPREDLAWTYRSPVAESAKIAGLICFFNEKVELVVDGVTQDRPHTQFS